MSINSYRALLQILFVVLTAGILFIWINNYDGLLVINSLKEEYGLKLLLITIPIQVILSVTPFPSEAFAFAAAVLLGFEVGILNIWIAWIIAAFVEYKLIQNAKTDFNIRGSSRRIPKFLKKIPINSPVFLILGLYLPFGSHIVIGSAAFNNVSILRLLVCCTIGYLPYSIIISGIANGLINNVF